MKLKKCKAGEKETLPRCCFEGGKDGWVNSEAPEDGLMVTLEDVTKAAGGVFLKESELSEVGYVNKEKVARILNLLDKRTLSVLAKVPEKKITKKQLIELVLK